MMYVALFLPTQFSPDTTLDLIEIDTSQFPRVLQHDFFREPAISIWHVKTKLSKSRSENSSPNKSPDSPHHRCIRKPMISTPIPVRITLTRPRPSNMYHPRTSTSCLSSQTQYAVFFPIYFYLSCLLYFSSRSSKRVPRFLYPPRLFPYVELD